MVFVVGGDIKAAMERLATVKVRTPNPPPDWREFDHLHVTGANDVRQQRRRSRAKSNHR
jgi:hypothetical protein